MNDLPQVLDVETLAQTRLFHIEAVDLAFSNGRQARFERLMGTGSGAVLVVPMVDTQNLLVVREYAVGLERYELGFVKGRIDGGESPCHAAQREMQEETGFAARNILQLASVALTPAYSNYRTFIFLARDLYADPRPGDEPEPLQTLAWPLTDLARLRSRDDFSDARSLLATYLVQDALKEES
ncbi:MAG: ADP compounds hydrolase NudE [Pseudomonadota bacterium]|nr:ADP compounds hydrolase NudE [Pseudomonadota bacterium]